MGTNYYLNAKPPCPCCGREYEPKHIGKSSVGWCFSLHVYPNEGINDLSDWVTEWSKDGATITNEYGDKLTPSEMLDQITKRSRPKKDEPYSYSSWKQFHTMNDSEDGPNNMLRHRLDRHCIKHGAGTWDCIIGEFS